MFSIGDRDNDTSKGVVTVIIINTDVMIKFLLQLILIFNVLQIHQDLMFHKELTTGGE